VSLEAWALISLDEAKEVIDTASPSDDLFLEEIINAATLACEAETGRKLKSRTYTGEVYDGTGGAALTIREYPVTSVSAVAFLTGVAPNVWTAQSTTTYPVTIVAPASSVLMYRNNAWPRGLQNVQLTYVAGYTSVPAAIKIACRQIAFAIWKQKDKQIAGVASQSMAGQTTTYLNEDFPKQAKSLLQPYVRVGF
jgi:hypothetical protein